MEFNFKELISNYYTKVNEKKDVFEMICNGNAVSGCVVEDRHYLNTIQLANIFNIELEKINVFKKQKENEFRRAHKEDKAECHYFTKTNYICTEIITECLYSCSDKFRNFVDNYILYGMFNSKVNILQAEPNDFKTSPIVSNLPTPKKLTLIVKEPVEMIKCFAASTSKGTKDTPGKDSLYIKKYPVNQVDKETMYVVKSQKTIKPDSDDSKKICDLISAELGDKDCCIGIATGKFKFREDYIFDKTKIDVLKVGPKLEKLMDAIVVEEKPKKSKKETKEEKPKEKVGLIPLEDKEEEKPKKVKKEAVSKFKDLEIQDDDISFSDDEDGDFRIEASNANKEEVKEEKPAKKTTKKRTTKQSKK